MSLFRCYVISLALAVGVGHSSHAQTAAIDPKARQVLDAMIAAYPALHSYAATVEVTDTVGKNPRGSVQTTRVAFRRPNEARVVSDGTGGHTQVVSDGTNIYEREPPTKMDAKPMYHAEPSDGQADGVTTTLRLGERGGTLLNDLITGQGFIKEITSMPGLTSMTLGPEEKTDGVQTQTVRVAWKEGRGEDVFTFSIGKSDHLLRRLNMGAHLPDKPVLVIKVEKHTHVQANPELDDAMFHFTLPPGSKILH